MPAGKTTRKQVLKTGFFKHLQNTDSLTVIQRLIFINFQTAPVFEQTAKKCIIFAVSKRKKCEPDGKQSGQGNPEGTVVLSPQTTKELKQRSTRVIYYDHGRSQLTTGAGHLLRPKSSAIKAWEEESKDAEKHKMMKLRSTQKHS